MLNPLTQNLKETVGIHASACYKPRPLRTGGGERLWRALILETFNESMSQHRSLRAASTSGAKRNVLKRFERVALLKKRSQWKTGDRVTGLRKTKPDA
jgi:small basic protein (TIGR04137 family)